MLSWNFIKRARCVWIVSYLIYKTEVLLTYCVIVLRCKFIEAKSSSKLLNLRREIFEFLRGPRGAVFRALFQRIIDTVPHVPHSVIFASRRHVTCHYRWVVNLISEHRKRRPAAGTCPERFALRTRNNQCPENPLRKNTTGIYPAPLFNCVACLCFVRNAANSWLFNSIANWNYRKRGSGGNTPQPP